MTLSYRLMIRSVGNVVATQADALRDAGDVDLRVFHRDKEQGDSESSELCSPHGVELALVGHHRLETEADAQSNAGLTLVFGLSLGSVRALRVRTGNCGRYVIGIDVMSEVRFLSVAKITRQGRFA